MKQIKFPTKVAYTDIITYHTDCGDFTLPDQWKEFLGPDILSDVTKIGKFCKELHLDRVKFIKRLRMIPEFASLWEAIPRNRSIIKGKYMVQYRGRSFLLPDETCVFIDPEVWALKRTLKDQLKECGLHQDEIIRFLMKDEKFSEWYDIWDQRKLGSSFNDRQQLANKQKQSCLKKYGVTSTSLVSEVRAKQLASREKYYCNKYGVSSLLALRLSACAKSGIFPYEIPPAFHARFTAICLTCYRPFKSMIYSTSSGVFATQCSCRRFHSLLEDFILGVVRALDPLADSDKLLIHPKEIDVYSPQFSIGFEINGAYFHNSSETTVLLSSMGPVIPKPRLYHSHKTTCALSPIQLDFNTLQPILDPQGSPIPKPSIKLYHIWEHWPHEISLSIIKAKLGLFDHTYYARHLTVTIVSSSKLEELCGSHTQGFIRSSFGVALYLDAVAVMGLLFTIKGDVAELTRGVNALNTRVIGGFARLFKAAISYIKEVHPQVLRIITYADRDLTPDQDSCVYVRHGFTYVGDCGPTLSYYFRNGYPNVRFNSNRVYARQRLQKHKLVLFEGVMCKHPITGEAALFKFDPQETEQQNLFRLNVHPVYNSGCFKYELVL